ncbi:radical SAM/SPASM domain-containing protein [Brachyspira pilosicoli]|uniref:Radical SAM/SPASM domain-containing protein n=1 Tax=Brachyspira pilosicoli TaxID=52584 RepID=A0A5C8ETT7_BRAPL|nr:radical SAM/SPASM domain-containing protein [Brachyspira pilosicoli]TXJ39640.1 radical SAM/SPASM domain-containing protein [Brachyspira pilosicoli]
MKKIKIFLDALISNIEKYNPDLYRRLVYDGYKKYSYIVNYIKYKDKYFFHGVCVEISTFCNRKCHYCPNKDYETPKKFMDWDTFKLVVSRLQDINFTGLFQYNFFNEPLFDDRLALFAEYVSKNLPKCIQVLVSNGDILNVDKAIELSNAGIDKFVITVHDDNPTNNLKRLQPVKNILKHKMKLQTSQDLYLNNRGGAVDVSNETRKTTYKTCQDIKNLNIMINGDVVLCCQDYFRKYVMGNIKEKDILYIWNSYKEIREELLKNNKARLYICKICLEQDKDEEN